MPIYGKLADLVGRKPVMLLGIGAVPASARCCAGSRGAWPALIAFRAVQGLGAGAVQPMGMTIVGDIYTVAERAKVQGYLASVWAISSVVGPTLGGVFADYVSWRWIFFVNIPLGLAAALAAVAPLPRERRARPAHRIDYAGAVLLAVGGSLLLLGLLEGGVRVGVGLAGQHRRCSSVAARAAGRVRPASSARAAEPVLPLWVFRQRVLIGGDSAALRASACC